MRDPKWVAGLLLILVLAVLTVYTTSAVNKGNELQKDMDTVRVQLKELYDINTLVLDALESATGYVPEIS